MVVLDDYTKKLVTELMDENGKIMIVDSMPDDLKRAIKSINDNNIDIFSTTPVEEVEELEEADEEEFGSSPEVEVQLTPNVVDDIKEDGATVADLDELNDLF